jgi:predicted DNA-binding transcriptional regulator AlpA
MTKLLYQEEVAELLRRPITTLRYWRVTGDGPKSFKLGGRVVYKLEDVDQWIEAQYNADTASRAG